MEPSWEHQAGVTLVGDAAHLMLPNGEGVNAAMFDSLLVSRAILNGGRAAGGERRLLPRHSSTLCGGEFEVALVRRAEEAGKDTDGLIGQMFGTDDAAYPFSSFLQAMAQAHSAS